MKYYGRIGFLDTVPREDDSTIYEEKLVYKRYTGDVTKNVKRYSESDKLNEDLTISNVISIVLDPYAYQNFHKIRCLEYMGALWSVNSVEVRYPRLLLTVGGVYNEPQTESE